MVLTKVANDETVDEGDEDTCNENDDSPDTDVVIVGSKLELKKALLVLQTLILPLPRLLLLGCRDAEDVFSDVKDGDTDITIRDGVAVESILVLCDKLAVILAVIVVDKDRAPVIEELAHGDADCDHAGDIDALVEGV